MKRAFLLCPLLVMLLTGCSTNLCERVGPTDIPASLQAYLSSSQEEPGAAFAVDPKTGVGYLQVSVGEADKLAQHLTFVRTEYHAASNTLTVYAEQYTPEWGKPGTHINSSDWLLVMRFKRFSFDVLIVVVDGAPDGQKIYVIDRRLLV